MESEQKVIAKKVHKIYQSHEEKKDITNHKPGDKALSCFRCWYLPKELHFFLNRDDGKKKQIPF